MNSFLIHPQTKRQIDNYLLNPSHAITLVAPSGSGKHSIAELLASNLLGIKVDKLQFQPYYKVISSVEDKAIGIESIRELEHFLSLKVPSKNKIHRVILIEDAETLTTEAQTAFLKTLEEPPTGTIFILTATHEQALLPTIRSRSPMLIITKPDHGSLIEYFDKQNYEDSDIKQALLVSGGLPGLTTALLSQNKDHPLMPATDLAKRILSANKYQRLLLVDELAKDRTLCLNTLFILQQMAHLSLISASPTNANRWLNILKASYDAQISINANNQSKLVLSNLMMHL